MKILKRLIWCLLWRVVSSMVEHRAKKVVCRSYADYGHELVIVRDRATGPPGAASVGLGTAVVRREYPSVE
jgi:hypothetical protein